MFSIDARILRALIGISERAPEEWHILTEWMKETLKMHISENLHSFPDTTDVNYRTRKDMNEGIGIALDVLYHLFSDPVSALDDMKIIDKMQQQNSPGEFI